MFIYDEATWEIVDQPDLSSVRVENRLVPVVHTWVEDGAGDGMWETRDAATGELVAYDGVVPSDAPRDEPVEDVWAYAVIVPLTDEERAEAEAANDAATARAAWLASAPEQAADLDEAVVELYEAQARAQLDTDEALTALYETILSMNGDN